MFSYLSTIDFIENLHKYESVENKGVMKTFIWSPELIWSAEFNTKEIRSSK
jgi:hypothetical protein